MAGGGAAPKRSTDADAATRAKALSEAGTFAWYRGDYDQAIALHGEALELYRQVGDDSGVAFALMCLGAQYNEKGDHERAAPFFEEALALSRRIGDKRNIAVALHNLADVERQRGNYERAKTLGMESIALAREMEDKWQLARIVGWVGLLAVFERRRTRLGRRVPQGGLGAKPGARELGVRGLLPGGLRRLGRGEGARGASGSAVGGGGGPAH